MKPTAASDWDDSKRAGLARHRLAATGLLLLMAAVFVATKLVDQPGFWVRLAEAMAEAAMVGGLADWFAVTALFRRPLGLPIPHTAVIPRNKDRIGEGIGRFVEANFLDPALVAERLQRANIARRLAHWLQRPGVPEAVADRLLASVPPLLDSMREGRLRAYFQRALRRELADLDLAPLLGRVIETLRESDRHHLLFDATVGMAGRFLEDNKATIYEAVEQKSAWWVPKTVDRRVAEAIVSGAADLLTDLSHEDHAVRREFDAAVARWVDALRTAPETRARVEQIKAELLDNRRVRQYLGAIWDQLGARLRQEADDPASSLRQAIVGALHTLGDALGRDPALQAQVNGWVAEAVQAGAVPWRGEIGAFIADVVRGWEAKTVTERIELAVGRDLQYIRINGTVVGALVGCGLFLIVEFLL